MRSLAAFVVALAFAFAMLGLLVPVRPAHACGNVTLEDDPAHRKLREADEALREGDVTRARTLASDVAGGRTTAELRRDLAKARAERIVALSFVRDRAATPDEIQRSIEELHRQLVMQQLPEPSLQADLGEAEARGGRDDDAYRHLSTLADRDLIGSPYAYAALARVAAKRGDMTTASSAAKRCAQITTDAGICRGEYPSPPLLRGKTLGYLLPGIVAAIALVRRRRARAPWSKHADGVCAAVVVLTIAFVFAYARTPWLTTSVTLVALAAAGVAQRLLFVSAVKRDRMPGWVLRAPAPEDAHLPAVASFFHSGQQVLERQPDASYRDPARVAVLRLGPRSRAARALVLVAAAIVLALVGASTLTMSARHTASMDSRVDL